MGECSSIIFDRALQDRLIGVVDKLAYKDGKEVQVSYLFGVGSGKVSDGLPVCDLTQELQKYSSSQYPQNRDIKTQGWQLSDLRFCAFELRDSTNLFLKKADFSR